MLLPMRRRLLLVVALLASVAAVAQQSAPTPPPPGAEPGKIAEGSYGSFDSWTLWVTPDEHLKAEIRMSIVADLAAKPGQLLRQDEVLEMGPDFTMRRFRYESANFRGLPDGALDCTVNPSSLDCTSTFQGMSGKGRIPASGGYATQFGVEIALLDLPWFFTTLVAQSDRDRAQPRTLGVLTIAFDGPTPDNLITGGGADAQVQYLGTDTIQVMGKAVKANKFQVEARHYSSTVWITGHGLLLRADWADMRIELTSFRQWIPVVPELPVNSIPAPPKRP